MASGDQLLCGARHVCDEQPARGVSRAVEGHSLALCGVAVEATAAACEALPMGRGDTRQCPAGKVGESLEMHGPFRGTGPPGVAPESTINTSGSRNSRCAATFSACFELVNTSIWKYTRSDREQRTSGRMELMILVVTAVLM